MRCVEQIVERAEACLSLAELAVDDGEVISPVCLDCGTRLVARLRGQVRLRHLHRPDVLRRRPSRAAN